MLTIWPIFTESYGRGYHRTAFLKDGSSGSQNGNTGGSSLGKKVFGAGKKSTEGEKKETFDDFFESLMKGQGQGKTSAAAPGTTGGVNLDGILSSLNKSPSEFKKEEADSRFAQIFQRKAVEQQQQKASAATAREEDEEEDDYSKLAEDEDEFDPEEEMAKLHDLRMANQESANKIADKLMPDEKEFADFMAALRADYKDKKQSAAVKAGMPSAVPTYRVKNLDKFPDAKGKSYDQLKEEVITEMKKLNPGLEAAASAAAASGTPAASRSETELLMARADAREQVDLDEALLEIRAGRLPAYVVRARVEDNNGELKSIDLLQTYMDQSQPAVASLAASEEDAKNELGTVERLDSESSVAVDAAFGDQEFLSNPDTARLFELLEDNSKAIEDMQYWSLYPKAVQRWLIYTRAPKGYYNDFGEWVVLPPKDLYDSLSDTLESMNRKMGGSSEEGEEAAEEGEEFGEDGERGMRGYGEEEEEEFEDFDDDDLPAITRDRQRDSLASRNQERRNSAAAAANKSTANKNTAAAAEEEEEFEEELGDEAYELTAAEEELLGEGEVEPVGFDGETLTEQLTRTEDELQELLDDPTAMEQLLSPTQSIHQQTDADWGFWEAQYQKEQQYLPKDLQGKFRFHILPEEIEGMHPRLRRHFSFKFASEGEITKFRAAEYVRKWGRHPGDTGNSAVQIAILTLRINHLTKVLRTHTTDSHNAYRLNGLVRRRKALMKHLKKSDLRTYYSLLQDIQLRDQVELWTSSRK